MKKRILAAAMVLLLALTFVPVSLAQEGGEDFTDVPDTHPHKTAIDYCVEYGFFKGKGGGLFDPDEAITREQLAVVWARTFSARIPTFTDATQPRDEVDNAIILMYALRYMNGISDTVFGHYGMATREQVLCIAQRTYLKGVDGGDAYKAYTDAESISDWAKNSVGACLNSHILDGVFSGTALDPQKAITRAEVAQIIFNVMKQKHDITVNAGTGGTITPSRTEAYPGEVITLEIEADTGMQLKDGSLKANGSAITGDSFVMPNRDVEVTAEFEPIPVPPALLSIEITANPKTSYIEGETLSTETMEVTAKYEGDLTKVVTGWTTDPAAGTELTTTGDFDLTVSYTEGDKTVTATVQYTVSSAS